MVRVEWSEMSAANGSVQAIIAHCEADPTVYVGTGARAAGYT
jgi:hypothetical protein